MMEFHTESFANEIVFLQLGLSRLGDKRGVSADEVEVDADKDTILIRKVIFKSPRFSRIKSFDSGVRKYVRQFGFPFEKSFHVIPKHQAELLNNQLKSFLEERIALVESFEQVYPQLILEASPKLRKLYNLGDYDPIEEVRDAFRMHWQFWQFNTPANLKDVSSELLREQTRAWEVRMNQAFEEARLVLRESCFKLLQSLRESLEPGQYGEAKRLNSSALTNLKAFANNFQIRNITNDVQLNEYVNQLTKLLDGVDTESLRTSDGFRMRIGSELNLIEQSIAQNMVIEPIRRIKKRPDATE